MPTYLLNAASCPALPIPTTALQNRTSESPLVLSKLALGDSIAILHKGNQNAVEAEILGRYGAGCYAVMTGLNLSIGAGLNVVVAAGQALIDAPRTISVATNVAVPDATTNGTIWMTQAGALTPSATTAPPAGNVAFLGFFTTAAGVVSAVDESGVLRLDQGNLPLRQTADVGCPRDTPVAGLRFLNKCVGGLFLWDGVTGYHNLTDSGVSTLTFGSDANKTLSSGEYSAKLLDFTSGGTALTVTRDVILPLTPAGRKWLVRNNSNGGQSLRFIGVSGAGITVATTKYAEIFADSVNILRVTPDT